MTSRPPHSEIDKSSVESGASALCDPSRGIKKAAEWFSLSCQQVYNLSCPELTDGSEHCVEDLIQPVPEMLISCSLADLRLQASLTSASAAKTSARMYWSRK